MSEVVVLQAYLVPIERDCKHIWPDSDVRLQAYLVSSGDSPVMKIVVKCGPALSIGLRLKS